MLKQNKNQFKYAEFIGDYSHFLEELKQRKDNITLKEINKRSLIEEYFKDKKYGTTQKFHRFVKEMQMNL